MSYWFTDPVLKNLFPLAFSSSIRGLSSNYSMPNLVIGPNAFPEGPALGGSVVDALAARCDKKRAYLVTDEHAERYAKRVSQALEAGGFTTEIWNKALPEAPLDNVKESAEAMAKFEPDLIVGVGGGSVIDGAKAAWIIYERPDITDLATLSPLTPLNLRKKAILAAVPTTSGTGSECTGVTVVHDTEAHRKVPVVSPELLPDYAILVPEFTISMPPKLTAGTGLDALAHAVDAVVGKAQNEFSDALGLKAIELVFKYLPRAFRNGQDREARHRMLLAAAMAGIAFGQNSTVLSHSFGHSVGAIFNIHHGLICGMYIPYSLQFYRTVSDKYLAICKALDLTRDPPEQALAELVTAIKDLLTGLEAPLTLKELGISKSDFEKNMDKLALFAIEDISTFSSPRPMTLDECKKILRYSYDGQDIDF